MQDFFVRHGIEKATIAVGVSGGADSLALALSLQEQGKKIVALTVDHGLRSESKSEAEYVASIMQKFGIEHHILTWDGEKPQTGVEEAARQARYNLLFGYCHQHNIKYLATGHHRRDQAETFLLRLSRGSGVFGLSGILPLSERDGITIIRPQLDLSPDDLKKYLIAKNVSWVEDPMNNITDFVRVRIRKFLPQLQDIGIDEAKLAQTAATLQHTRGFLQKLCDKFVSDYVRWYGSKVASISLANLADCDEEISRLVLGELIRLVGGGNYSPEAESVHRIIAEGENFKGCTLGGCELEVALGRLWIIPQDESNVLLSTEQWNEFVAHRLEFANSGLPYKVRRAIWQNWKE